MVVTTLIVSILTLIATIAFPIMTLIKNRLRFSIQLISIKEKRDNNYNELLVDFDISNLSAYPIIIHKIELKMKSEYPIVGYHDGTVVSNHPIGENEKRKFNVSFMRIYYLDKTYKEITVYTNKKNYTFPISLN